MSNSLSKVHPELISEWSDRNYPLTPDNITFGSNKIVWWKGSCGHEWQASVKSRSSGENCPICSGKRVVTGINDLATLKPELVKEWSDKNTLKPTEVTVGSHKKIIWKCKLGHEWEATVKSRTLNGTGCPYCSHNSILERFAETLADTRNELENTKNQFETAKKEVEKPFVKEEELKAKTARLDELNILLNMDKRENEIVGGEPDEGDDVPTQKSKDYER